MDAKKTNLPLRNDVLPRPRLHALIEEGLEYPLLVLLAPPGYGKTQAMAHYLAQADAAYLWLRLVPLDNRYGHFWEHLLRGLQRDYPEMVRRLKAVEFPRTLLEWDVFLQILAEEGRQSGRLVWVFDDVGEVVDQEILLFFRTLAEAGLENFRLVLISNRLKYWETIACPTSQSFFLYGKDLRFTREEMRDMCHLHHMALSPGDVEAIEQYTEGWPLLLYLILSHGGRPYQNDPATLQTIFYLFEKQFFSAYSRPLQKLFIKLSLLNAFTLDIALDLHQGEREEMDFISGHAFISTEPMSNRLQFHNLYQQFLSQKKYMLSAEEEQEFWQTAAYYYRNASELYEAILCFRKAGDYTNMLQSIFERAKVQYGVRAEDAAFYLEHINLVQPEDEASYPMADSLRALIYLNTLALDKAEEISLRLIHYLSRKQNPEQQILLGETYGMVGAIHMMRSQEDFGDYYRKAAALLPNGTAWHNKHSLQTQNNHVFSIADNQPGALERMEKAVYYGVEWMQKVFCGAMGGMEYLFSAEAAYLTYRLEDAKQHAYRAIYKAEGHNQHDLVCNAYCVLARVAHLQGNLREMTQNVEHVAEYAGRHEIIILDEIRDTAQFWYYVKLQDVQYIPRSILVVNHSNLPALAQGRLRIVYANYLLNTGEYARVVGMLENPQGLHLAQGIWQDRIALFILLAIAYQRLGKRKEAIHALWRAYDMGYHNGLITLFVEAGSHMVSLIDGIRSQDDFHFAPDWVDLVYQKATDFEKRSSALKAEYRKQQQRQETKNPLTKREIEVLCALSRGMTREEIAIGQYISINTVKTFIRSIYNKLDAANRAEAVSIAIANGYINGAASSRASQSTEE